MHITTRLVWALIMSSLAGVGLAAVPGNLSYQAYLTDPTGSPIDTDTTITFAIYNVEMGGAPLWSDTRVVFVDQGLLSVDLGYPGNPFPAGLFNTPLWIGITVSGDAEMTPRGALTSAPYAHEADNAETVSGQSAFSLDQSAEVAALQTDVVTVQSGVTQLQTEVAGAQADINQVQNDVGAAQTDISQLQTDLASTDSILTTVEDTLPMLQPLVSQSCSAGSSIRVISSTGTVTCEPDDQGPWSLFNSNAYFLSGSVGVGTSSPVASIQIDAPAGTDPFRARVQSSTKLRVHANGSVSVGTSGAGPENGLYVIGDTGLGTASPAARLSVSDSEWQMTLNNFDTGGNEWYVGSSADAWASSGGKFVISPTGSSGNAALIIDANKDVGIGTLDPLTRLHLAGGSDVTIAGGGYLTLGSTASANIAIDSNEIMARNNGAAATLALNAEGGMVSFNTNGDRFADAARFLGGVEFAGSDGSILMAPVETGGGTDSTIQMRPDSFEGGGVGSASFPFFSVYARTHYAWLLTSYQAYSDRSLKRDIKPITGALDIVGQLQGVSYAMNDHPHDDGIRKRTAEETFRLHNQIGFIAQDVEQVLPQLVQVEEETGLKTMGYMGIIPLLVEGMKEQQGQIDAQQRLLEAQQAEIAALKRLIQE